MALGKSLELSGETEARAVSWGSFLGLRGRCPFAMQLRGRWGTACTPEMGRVRRSFNPGEGEEGPCWEPRVQCCSSMLRRTSLPSDPLPGPRPCSRAEVACPRDPQSYIARCPAPLAESPTTNRPAGRYQTNRSPVPSPQWWIGRKKMSGSHPQMQHDGGLGLSLVTGPRSLPCPDCVLAASVHQLPHLKRRHSAAGSTPKSPAMMEPGRVMPAVSSHESACRWQ